MQQSTKSNSQLVNGTLGPQVILQVNMMDQTTLGVQMEMKSLNGMMISINANDQAMH